MSLDAERENEFHRVRQHVDPVWRYTSMVNIKGFTKTHNKKNKYKIAYLHHLNEIKYIVILKKKHNHRVAMNPPLYQNLHLSQMFTKPAEHPQHKTLQKIYSGHLQYSACGCKQAHSVNPPVLRIDKLRSILQGRLLMYLNVAERQLICWTLYHMRRLPPVIGHLPKSGMISYDYFHLQLY